MFTIDYSIQIPRGSINERYDANSTIGASFRVKLKSNLMLGFRGQYLFGGKVNDSTLFQHILPSGGRFINIFGEEASVIVSERGFYFAGEIGKVIPVFKHGKNSGILLQATAGLLQYKTRIDNDGNNVPQILNDYKKGYDRLTNGLCISEFVGYQYIGKSQIANFYFGFEFYQAWTQCRRNINFDVMAPDTEKKKDYLYSFRVGWIIPLYKRSVDNVYYYF
ncbi:MAG: hypothetical protein A2W91_00130 [Bacteroidetes bacterium GWF2_38_335]|nr:MAG: hypothetical protein A2W91_00130 [Bacteroidetes bacterium GWF2_38_335]OFY79728.1 MAG: hypothetical protein A2281_09725 [Bacteroidetes bacterium RIFOXYA12_FULL_38_20]HBS87566.1 hypothetical protein [Bacteroidales bacterium]